MRALVLKRMCSDSSNLTPLALVESPKIPVRQLGVIGDANSASAFGAVGEAEEEVSLAHDVATVNRDGLTGNITCC